MYACILHEYAEDSIDISRVIRMLLVQDLVEAGAGDAPIHGGKPAWEQSDRKTRCAQRLLGLLPEPRGAELLNLWQEFEAARSEDACFARALQRFQPLLLNMFTEGGACKVNDVSLEQGQSGYGPVLRRGAPRLWALCEAWIERTVRPA